MSKPNQQTNYSFALTVVIVVCFLLGFITTMNNSMIDFCKQTFGLSETQGQLVNTAFYGAYILSIPLAFLMNRIGYKKTLVLGLGVIALGFFLNYFGIGIFADSNAIYPVFLSCMFCVAIGIVLLQLVANPYVMALGSPEKGAFRMTLSQTFNSVATTVAPIFVSMLIVSGAEGYNASSIKVPFLGLAIFTLVLCLILSKIKLPAIKEGEESYDKGKTYKSSVFQYPHTILCGLAIFMYMGVEIGVPSFIPAKFRGLLESGAIDAGALGFLVDSNTRLPDPTKLLPFYWGGMLVGRALGTVILSRLKPRIILTTSVLISMICIGLSFVLPGMAGIYALVATGLFHSIMWPLIFNLGLEDLGPNTKAASGVINTGVIGAAILTPLMGKITEVSGLSIAIGMLFIYYLYILLFSAKLSKIRPK
ncbi:MFS transporter [Bacteroidales bacterium OttesenSCG-928-J19]|nr:MFS transporter [Bacteroidales bacterium OttesenSCG-928-J19]